MKNDRGEMRLRMGEGIKNKKAYCTYCSREKRNDPRLLQAIERYESDRIRAVHELAVQFHDIVNKHDDVRPSIR